ncbi:MAG: radical SAM protein, partial [Desulfobacterales bacterium]|nr:radical SAM protein [Desulfobacterales bacterium]
DGVSERAFRKINRPCKGISAKDVAAGIKAMAREFSGEIWLEIFILPGVNNTPEEMDLLKAEILEIQPTRVQLNTLDRPGTLDSIGPASREELEAVAAHLDLDNLEIIAKVAKKQVKTPAENLESAVLETIHRRPCTREDLVSMLGARPGALEALLEELLNQGRIEVTREARGEFYRTIKE